MQIQCRDVLAACVSAQAIRNAEHGQPLTWIDGAEKGAVVAQKVHAMPAAELQDGGVIAEDLRLVDPLCGIGGNVCIDPISLLVVTVVVVDCQSAGPRSVQLSRKLAECRGGFTD